VKREETHTMYYDVIYARAIINNGTYRKRKDERGEHVWARAAGGISFLRESLGRLKKKYGRRRRRRRRRRNPREDVFLYQPRPYGACSLPPSTVPPNDDADSPRAAKAPWVTMLFQRSRRYTRAPSACRPSVVVYIYIYIHTRRHTRNFPYARRREVYTAPVRRFSLWIYSVLLLLLLEKRGYRSTWCFTPTPSSSAATTPVSVHARLYTPQIPCRGGVYTRRVIYTRRAAPWRRAARRRQWKTRAKQ